MIEQKYLALHSQLAKVDPEKKAHLVSYLPDSIREGLERKDFPTHTLPVEMSVEKIARRVDCSHFKAYLDTLPAQNRRVFLSAFPKYKQVELTGPDEETGEYVSPGFSRHVLSLLFKKMLDGYPPPTILPMHQIAELLSDTGVPLAKLITFLGLFDVVAEIKQVISSKTLKLLQSAFDKEEITFMNSLGRKDTIPILSPMNLGAYKGDSDRLRELIEERGCYRFARGIVKGPAEYYFYFMHFLPKRISEKVDGYLNKKPLPSTGYANWESDVTETWRCICTYSH